MLTYSICPIAVCQGQQDGSQFTYQANYVKTFKNASYAWYIKGSQQKILVDTGARPSTFRKKGVTSEIDLITVENGLAKLRLTPEDIDIVIITHLHGDHIELASLYKKAQFIIQKKELEYTKHPHPIHADLYEKQYFESLNFDIIDGDKKIDSGISVFLTPGHSPGGQSVQINTPSGQVIITGFCCSMDTFKQTEDMKRLGWEVTIPLIHDDVREAYDSVLKVKRKADIILALHDPEYIGREIVP
jgi:glyoxylase-like metal-dependent hydrolase (beta-lactamase superfamily II)